MEVRIEDIVNTINSSAEDTDYYYDMETGDLEMTVDGELLGNQDIDLTDDERYIALPDIFELEEEEVAQKFANQEEDESAKTRLLDAIQDGANPYSPMSEFETALQELNLAEAWQDYRKDAIRQMAIEWCDFNGIDYTEGSQETVTVGGIYQHFKGKRYKVLNIAKHSETLDEMVIYQALYGEGTIWARPLRMFCDTVMEEGQPKPRFELVETPENIDK